MSNEEVVIIQSQFPSLTLSHFKIANHALTLSPTAVLDHLLRPSQKSFGLKIYPFKQGLLCESTCNFLDKLLNNLKKYLQTCNQLRIEVDIKNILEAGGIHYHLPTQLQTVSKYMNVQELFISLSSESFNDKCLESISQSFAHIQQLTTFSITSKTHLSSLACLSKLPNTITSLHIELIRPSSQELFVLVNKYRGILQFLKLFIEECDESFQGEFVVFTRQLLKNPSKIKAFQLSLSIDFTELFLLSKEKFYESIKESIQNISQSKNTNLIYFSLNTSSLEESGLFQNILVELSKVTTHLKTLELFPNVQNLPRTLIISILYKLKELLEKSPSLQNLVLGFNIAKKDFDILESTLSQKIEKLQTFEYLPNKQQLLNPHIHINTSQLLTIRQVKGVRIICDLTKLRYLTEYSYPSLQNYMAAKRKLIFQIEAIKRFQIIKRTEILQGIISFML